MPSAQADGPPPLLAILRETIARDGPLPIDRYMQICMGDPDHGYWRKAATIGARGDFVTAPEISQVFGELIGVWAVLAWEAMGRPSPVRLVEMGPGRGTLMCDALRAVRAAPAFLDAATVHLVETSAPLRALQRDALMRANGAGMPAVCWHEALADVSPGAAIVVGNEFLDALPIRQLVYDKGAWRERMVGLGPDRRLAFVSGHAVSHQSREPQDGAVAELRAGERDLLATLGARSAPFVALFVDYGPAEDAFGDTLQAVRDHAYAGLLAHPGMADLTAHVRFGPLADTARTLGLAADGPLTQAEFLARLGIVERATRLMAANPARAGDIEAAVQRLVSPTGMGGLFKALAVRSHTLPPTIPFG